MNVTEDEKMLDAVKRISEYCRNHGFCKGCVFRSVNGCYLINVIETGNMPCSWARTEESNEQQGNLQQKQ